MTAPNIEVARKTDETAAGERRGSAAAGTAAGAGSNQRSGSTARSGGWPASAGAAPAKARSGNDSGSGATSRLGLGSSCRAWVLARVMAGANATGRSGITREGDPPGSHRDMLELAPPSVHVREWMVKNPPRDGVSFSPGLRAALLAARTSARRRSRLDGGGGALGHRSCRRFGCSFGCRAGLLGSSLQPPWQPPRPPWPPLWLPPWLRPHQRRGRPFRRRARSAGSVTVKVEPAPTRLSTAIRPRASPRSSGRWPAQAAAAAACLAGARPAIEAIEYVGQLRGVDATPVSITWILAPPCDAAERHLHRAAARVNLRAFPTGCSPSGRSAAGRGGPRSSPPAARS